MNNGCAFKTVEKIYAHSEVCLKPAEALNMSRENREGKVYQYEAAHDFLELLIFLSHSLKRSNQHLSGHRSNIFFKINSSKMTYSHLRNKFIKLIRKAEAKVNNGEVQLTSPDTPASEIQIPLNHKGSVWVGTEWSLDFTGCDSHEPRDSESPI